MVPHWSFTVSKVNILPLFCFLAVLSMQQEHQLLYKLLPSLGFRRGVNVSYTPEWIRTGKLSATVDETWKRNGCLSFGVP